MSQPSLLPHRSLGDLLALEGLISQDQLRIAQLEQNKTRQPLGKLLVSLGFLSESALCKALGAAAGHVPVDLAHTTVEPQALALIPRDVAKHYGVLPLGYDAAEQRLTVAMADPDNLLTLDRLRQCGSPAMQVEALLAGEQAISQAIDQYYGHELSIDGILQEIETGKSETRLLTSAAQEYSQPIVRLVDALLTDAVKRGASDLHFEPEAAFLRIRYRIDGILRQIRALHRSYWNAMTVRIKVMASMNIAESRAPQDGRISLAIGGRVVDFRVSSQPTIHGENLVLRILDRQKGIVPLDRLGLQAHHLEHLRLMMARPEGIILVTGPTGSGKTTTLYSMLDHINRESVNIMTLEDPVEYPMALIRQTSVAESVKLDFANGIRSMMRQDPDVILVGEIRDTETAQMAFRAAMTGHRVFATLHSNSALGAIPRLLDIGIPADILAGNVTGIIAQRLVRRLCPHCLCPRAAQADEAQLLGLAEDERKAAAFRLFSAQGCERCQQQGYSGRFALMELLRIDDELDDLIASRASAGDIRQAAVARGFQPLAEDGVRRVLDGSTSLEEVARVVDLTRRR